MNIFYSYKLYGGRGKGQQPDNNITNLCGNHCITTLHSDDNFASFQHFSAHIKVLLSKILHHLLQIVGFSLPSTYQTIIYYNNSPNEWVNIPAPPFLQ